MPDVIVSEFMTLDGVVQAPAYPDEDTSNGFAHGGWHVDYIDEAAMKWTLETVSAAGGFLLGRRTYEIFAAHWPNAGEEEQALAAPMNAKPKYVASRTLTEPLEWQNSSLLGEDVAKAVRTLKHEDGGGDLVVIGSTELAQTLLREALVDQFRLMIDPLVVGTGKRLFAADDSRVPLRLLHSQTTPTGAVLATYAARAE
jgi:dihydrofolate reductase